MARETTFSTIEIKGLRELIRDLRAEDKKLPKRIAQANQKTAEFVAGVANFKRLTVGGSALRTTVRAGRRADAATVVLGGKKNEPFAFGAEFGALPNIRRRPRAGWKRRYSNGLTGWNQFRPWRGNQWTNSTGDRWSGPVAGTGYFLYPAIRDTHDDVLRIYGSELDRALQDLSR